MTSYTIIMQLSPARQPLHERSVNTPTAAIGPEPVTKTSTSLKRRINNVDSPEYPASPLRLRVNQQSPLKDYTSATTMTAKVSFGDVGFSCGIDCSQTSQPNPVAAMTQTVQMKDTFEEDDSQDTLNDSLLSRSNSDPMEDTMVSEQTASTEVSQLDRSAASVVSPVNVGKPSVSLTSSSTPSSSGSDFVLPCSKFERVKRISRCHYASRRIPLSSQC